MPDEPSRKPPGHVRGDQKVVPEEQPGQLAEDDRGNVTWQWANNEVLQADDTAGAIERLRALVDPRLGVIEDEAPKSLRDNHKGLKTGYNPYNSGALGKTERKKKKNLRELSKWIETKRKLESKVGDKDESGE